MGVADLRNKAKDAFKRKRYDYAVEVYLELLQFEPDDKAGVEGFFQAAKKARETKGKSLFGGMLSKVSVGSSKNPKKRMASAFRALAKNPEAKGVLMALGDAALEAGCMNAASEAYKHAAEADPADSTPWKRLGEALGRRGDIPEALDALSRAVSINPKDQEASKLRKNLAAEGALKLSGYETAKSSRDLIKDEKVAQDLETEVRLQLTPEHAATEIDKLRAELAENPNDARKQVRLADLELNRGNEAEALEALKAALKIDPENYDLSVRVGDLELRDVTGAYKAAKQAADEAPDDEGLKSALHAAREALVEANLAEHRRRVKAHPLDLAARFTLGRWLFEAGKTDEALQEFQQTVNDPNRKTESLRFQAKCFEKKGIISLAVKKVEEAAKDFPTLASPRSKEVNYELADLLERKGELDRARDIFERIVEADAGFKDALNRLEKLSASA